MDVAHAYAEDEEAEWKEVVKKRKKKKCEKVKVGLNEEEEI
jgi:predicted component of type VI protein secretion system